MDRVNEKMRGRGKKVALDGLSGSVFGVVLQKPKTGMQ